LVKAARRTVLDFYQNTRRAKAAFAARPNLAAKIAPQILAIVLVAAQTSMHRIYRRRRFTKSRKYGNFNEKTEVLKRTASMRVNFANFLKLRRVCRAGFFTQQDAK
jgi:hypothetical protein